VPGLFFHPHPTRTRMQASKIPTRNDLAEFTAVSTDAEPSSAIWSSVCHCNVCWELWSCCCLAVFGRATNLQRLWSPNRQFTREKLERLHAQFHGIFPATNFHFVHGLMMPDAQLCSTNADQNGLKVLLSERMAGLQRHQQVGPRLVQGHLCSASSGTA
jgi:hypothetical protein